MSKRLTKRLSDGRAIGCLTENTIQDLVNKLADYEDAEENGLFITLPCKEVWSVVDRGTKFAMVMSKPISDLTLYEIAGIDEKGYYWSSEEKANQAMADSSK